MRTSRAASLKCPFRQRNHNTGKVLLNNILLSINKTEIRERKQQQLQQKPKNNRIHKSYKQNNLYRLASTLHFIMVCSYNLVLRDFHNNYHFVVSCLVFF